MPQVALRMTSSTVQAGRLIRAIGWFQLTVALSFAAYLLFEVLSSRDPRLDPSHEWYPLVAFALALGATYLFVGSALKKHASWSRWAGGILAIFALLYFPVGTVLGSFVLWFLIRGRHEGPARRIESRVA